MCLGKLIFTLAKRVTGSFLQLCAVPWYCTAQESQGHHRKSVHMGCSMFLQTTLLSVDRSVQLSSFKRVNISFAYENINLYPNGKKIIIVFKSVQNSVLQGFLFIWLNTFVKNYSLYPGQKKSNSPPFIYMPFFWEGSALPFCPSYPPEHTAMTSPSCGSTALPTLPALLPPAVPCTTWALLAAAQASLALLPGDIWNCPLKTSCCLAGASCAILILFFINP